MTLLWATKAEKQALCPKGLTLKCWDNARYNRWKEVGRTETRDGNKHIQGPHSRNRQGRQNPWMFNAWIWVPFKTSKGDQSSGLVASRGCSGGQGGHVWTLTPLRISIWGKITLFPVFTENRKWHFNALPYTVFRGPGKPWRVCGSVWLPQPSEQPPEWPKSSPRVGGPTDD